ncbi:hypothetical protein CQ13_09355 [Bradyrhizobium retamae]|uniref:Uncharacterized protein n=1 Tax=Bradyrhizobium retamae TaxID=1300035 RepID=A0A0R3MEW7_9BRAD|nr:hypothetical protein CQ13_09355 [Bradyrhizobium retamae]
MLIPPYQLGTQVEFVLGQPESVGRLAPSGELIHSQVGYDPSHQRRFDKWHERIALNYQSAPKVLFHVFSEAHTVVYELIIAGPRSERKTQ